MEKKSLYGFWKDLKNKGREPGEYKTFWRWVSRVEEEAVKNGYLKVRNGKKKRYIVVDGKKLIDLMCKSGFAL
jgi:hypothetical protein